MQVNIPKNITPKEFFEEFLPQEHKRLGNELNMPFKFTAGAEILGKGGGDWSLEYDNGDLTISRGIPDEPLFTISIKKEDWQKALDNELTSVFISTADKDNTVLKYLNQTKIEKLKKEHGKINIIIDNLDYEGEVFNFEFSILIGEPLDSDPELTMNISKKEFEAIRANPQNLYKLISTNQLKINGDFRYLMKLATMVFF